MELHDKICAELFEYKSLAALMFLIDCGRELEFMVYGKEYFLSKSNSKKYVSLWENSNEQSFDSVYELISYATIFDKPFINVWNDAELTNLF